jgi:hypothetical protein
MEEQNMSSRETEVMKLKKDIFAYVAEGWKHLEAMNIKETNILKKYSKMWGNIKTYLTPIYFNPEELELLDLSALTEFDELYSRCDPKFLNLIDVYVNLINYVLGLTWFTPELVVRIMRHLAFAIKKARQDHIRKKVVVEDKLLESISRMQSSAAPFLHDEIEEGGWRMKKRLGWWKRQDQKPTTNENPDKPL